MERFVAVPGWQHCPHLTPFADHGHHGHHDKCIARALSCPLFLRVPGSSGNFD